MRIAIVGAGAIGAWFGTRLARAGHTVSVLARGATLEAIRKNGLQLVHNGETITAAVQASNEVSALGAHDLVVVALKGPSLTGAAHSIAQLLAPGGAVLSAMNGVPWWFFHGLPATTAVALLRSVDPEGNIGKLIPSQRVIGCVVHAACTVESPGCSLHKSGNRLVIGEPGGVSTSRLESTVAAFSGAGFDVQVSASIQQDIWYKLWGNMTMNPISALTGATGDRILDDSFVSDYVLRVMNEAAEVGARIGCPIMESGEDRNRVTRKLGAFRTSMLQDAEAGRPLEIDALLAAPIEIARQVSVQTPYMDALYGLTRLFAATKGLNP